MTPLELIAAADAAITLTNRLLAAIDAAVKRGELSAAEQSALLAKVGDIRARVGLPPLG